MTTKITSASDITISPSGLENAVTVEQDGDLQLKKDVRLPNNQSVVWRNFANSSDLNLTVDAANDLKYNSLTLVSSTLGLIPLAAIENGGGGGGSGFTLQLTAADLTAVSNTHYLTDTSTGPVTITLPTGVAQFTIRFSDDQRTWGQYPLNILPATGQSLDGFAPDEPLICDLTGASIQVSWDGTKWVIDSNVVLGALSGGGANSVASSEKSYVTRPDNANADWASSDVGLVLVGTEAVASNLPESATKSSAIRITRVSGTTGYVRYRMVLDPTDLGKTLKIQWAQRYLGTTGDYSIQVFGFSASDYTTGSTQLPVKNSTIPSGGSSTFVSAFDSNFNLKYIELRIVALAGTTPLYLSGVFVGPGTIVQGAVVGEWSAFTPTFNNVTISNNGSYWRRIGSSIQITVDISATADATGIVQWIMNGGLPGVTPDTSKFGARQIFGAGALLAGTLNYVVAPAYTGTAPLVRFAIDGSANLDATNPAADGGFDTNDRLTFSVMYPVAEWSGQGTVSILPGAQPIYAFNSSTSAISDSTSFGYGEDGALVQAFSSTLLAAVSKRVRSPYPNPKFVQLQVRSGGQWVPLASSESGFSVNDAGTTRYGVEISPIGNGTDYDVSFYSQPYPGSVTWATRSSAGYRWRVVFADTPAAVGIPIADLNTTGSVNTTTQSIAGDKTFVASTNTVATFKRSVAGTSAIAFKTSDDVSRALIGANTTDLVFLNGAGSITYGSLAHTTGVWTIGATSDTSNVHSVYGAALSIERQLRLRNLNPNYANLTSPTIYSTSTGGAGVFTEAGHLVLEPRLSGVVRDVIVMGTGEVPMFRFNGGGSSTFGPTSGAVLSTHNFYGVSTTDINSGNPPVISISNNDAPALTDVKYTTLRLNKARAGANTAFAGIGVRNTGTTSASSSEMSFQIRNSADTATIIAGTIDNAGVWRNTAGTWSTISDARLKENIQTLGDSLSLVMKLNPVSYDWKEEVENKENRPTKGFIAQEMLSVMPSLVTETQEFNLEGALTIATSSPEMLAHLVRSIQQLEARLSKLESE